MADAKKPTRVYTGRKLMLTPERRDRIAQLLREGNNHETAAHASGISTAAYFRWLGRGRNELERMAKAGTNKPKASEAVYADFAEHVENARADANAELVSFIKTAAQDPKTWQAAAWLLERRDPTRWGRTSREGAQKDAGKTAGAVAKSLDSLKGGPSLPEEPAK